MLLDNFIEINPKVKLEKGVEYPFVEMGNVTPRRRYVFAKSKRQYSGGGSRFCSGDVLIARITPCLENGKIAQYKSPNKDAFGSTEFIVFREKPGVSYQPYIYYLALTDIIRKPAEKSMFGASGRQRADLSLIKNIEVPDISLPTQRKIAAILSAYDDLIENNLRRIKILEEMAQSIYNEWFVKFRFPGHEKVSMVVSPLGRMPSEWEIKPIGNAVQILGGGTPSTKNPEYWDSGNIVWFTPSDLTSTAQMFISDSVKKITIEGLQESSAKLFPAYSVMMTSRATIGVVAINTIGACTNQGFIICIPNEEVPASILYYWILNSKERIVNLASGATFKEISRGEFREFPIIIANHDIVILFDQAMTPIFKEIECLLLQNRNLRYTCDLLLPKLVSGEIDVSNLDIKMGDDE
ncbi:restriction endonuclease subunit S [Chloroflexota bacterium]